MKVHMLERVQHVPLDVEETFRFYSEIDNLERITPPWLDFRILCCTACRMVGVPFRVSGRVLGIPTHEAIEEAMKPASPEAPPAPAPRVYKAAA